MTATINTPAPTPPYIEVAFSWSPYATAESPSPTLYPSLTLYPIVYLNAPVNTAVTFTAWTRIDNADNEINPQPAIIEYRWDFGDGAFDYGHQVTHTFKIANPNLIANLRVTDRHGREWFARSPIVIT